MENNIQNVDEKNLVDTPQEPNQEPSVPAAEVMDTDAVAEKVANVVQTVGKAAGKTAVAVGKVAGKTATDVAKAGVKVAVKGTTTAAFGGIFGALSPILIKIVLGVLISAALAGISAAVVKYIKDSDALRIADTPNIIQDIKKISEFTTYSYIEECVIKDKKSEAKESAIRSFFNKETMPDSLVSEVVIITRGVVRAGYDLAKIGENDLKVSNDTITVKLPDPEIFDVIVNPSNIEYFVEEGTWSHEEITALQVNSKNSILENAIEYGIMEKASTAGKEKVQNLFKTFGFNVVEIQ